MSGIYRPEDLRGMRVLLFGLGVNQGGLGVARFLSEHGAVVRVTDLQSAEQLAESIAELRDLPVEFSLGRHVEEDFDWAEMVVRNPAVRGDSPWLDMVRARGLPIEMEMTLFFRFCVAPIIGVTGTKGKTTTTSILGSILRQRWPDTVLAGNMGRSALGQLGDLKADNPVALELSSFQLEALDEQRLSPAVAVLTNVSEDHLDRYESLDAYASVKAAIGRHQRPDDWLVVPRDDPYLAETVQDAPARRVTFGLDPVEDDHALWVADGHFAGRWAGVEINLGAIEKLRIPGVHNHLNALAAAGAALASGMTSDEVMAGIAAAEAVSNRLETVAVIDGVEYVNDTTATTPIAAVAALHAFAGREIVLIAGGSSKNASLEPLAAAIERKAGHVVLLDGAATPSLKALLNQRHYASYDGPFDSMDAAVKRCRDLARQGSVVLLSPGCASFGMFRNEFHRGDAFRAAVQALESGAP